MDSLMQMQRRITVTVHHPPLLLRWVLAAIFAATTLACLRESLYWLVFSIHYGSVPQFLAVGLGHLLLYALLTSLAGAAAFSALPRGSGTLAAALDDDASEDDDEPVNA